ncbi:MAG: hypothetical protein ACOYO1_16375 [Bacteroidales bacterium]
MNKFRFTVLILIILSACNYIDSNKKTIDVIPDDVFAKDINDRTQITKSILEKFKQSIIAISQTDTTFFYYGNNVLDGDSMFRQVLIGKFLDNMNIIAIEVNLKDTLINFFTLDHNNEWKISGSERTNIDVYTVEFEDFNGDSINEIITSTSPNMNANSWKEVYYYSKCYNTIKYAGSFSTDYKVNIINKEIEETYEGSNYMDLSKTLYQWRKEKIVPIKRIIIAYNNDGSNKSTFEYYENLTSNIDGLKLIFKTPYNNDNKKQRKLWDNFFNRH